MSKVMTKCLKKFRKNAQILKSRSRPVSSLGVLIKSRFRRLRFRLHHWFTLSIILTQSRFGVIFRLNMIKQKHGKASKTLEEPQPLKLLLQSWTEGTWSFNVHCERSHIGLLAMACKMWHVRPYPKLAVLAYISVQVTSLHRWNKQGINRKLLIGNRFYVTLRIVSP